MPRYSAFVATDDGPGHYQEIEQVIDAPDPRSAAQQAIDVAAIDPDDQFPVILVVEEAAVSIFSRDDAGRAATPTEDFPRLLQRGPATVPVPSPLADEVKVRSGEPRSA
jgi:hypothetical protein